MRAYLRSVFGKRADPYAGVDLANVSRFGGALWFLGALLTALILPFVGPDHSSFGDGGWVLAAALIAGSVLAGIRMRHAADNVNEVLAYSYCAVVAIALLVWLSGGLDSPYAQMFILSALYTCAAHPARRVVPYLTLLFVAVLLPAFYDDGASTRAVVELSVELLVWMALALAVVFLMHNVRAQRLGLRREGERARRQARLDQLTELLNRRAFDEDLARAIDRARAGREPLSVLVGDLDDFKDFNDRFGHLEGDRVLRAVAESLKSALRRPDIAYRWGGDEFALILDGADVLGAEQVAARVREAVSANRGPDGAALTMATGVAQLDVEGSEAGEDLVDRADQALLRAKGSGTFEIPQTRG